MKIIYLVLLVLLLAGCAKTESLQEVCANDGNMFMTMKPMVNGVPTGDPACAGCMVNGGHFCNLEEYNKAAGK